MPYMNQTSGNSIEAIFDQMNNAIFSKEELESGDSKLKLLRDTSHKVFELCCDFLSSSKLITTRDDLKIAEHNKIVSMEDFSQDANLNKLGKESLLKLVQDAGVEKNLQHEAMKSLNLLLAKARAAQGSNETFLNAQFGHGRENSELSAAIAKSNASVFAPSVMPWVTNFGVPSQESFGAQSDKVLPDLPAAMAITMLLFIKGFTDRIIHRRTSNSPYITYVMPWGEIYNISDANDKDHKVRNDGDHRKTVISLYADASPVDNQLQLIVPLSSNDTEGVLFADGIVKFNNRANLFDLSMIPGKYGYTHINNTDLVSENVVVDSIFVKLAQGSTEEIFQIDLHDAFGSALTMRANPQIASLRSALVKYVAKFGKNTKTYTGNTSTLLAACTDTDFVKVRFTGAFEISLQTADAEAVGSLQVTPFNRDGSAVDPAVATLVNGLTASLVGYTLDARFSEENLRKSNLGALTNVKTFQSEISNGRMIFVDSSLQQDIPEFTMPLVTELISLGQDHRTLEMIVRTMKHVYNRSHEENANPGMRDRLDTVGFNFVSGQKIRPMVVMDVIDINNVDTIRSSDIYGDVRNYVEYELMKKLADLFSYTYYRYQIQGKPKFKVLTSSAILDLILAVPHIHNHLNIDPASAPSNVEFQRILPNGTELDIITTTFAAVRNKMIVIPYIDNAPEDEKNFGHNWDYGLFSSYYTPQFEQGVHKRWLTCARHMIYPTDPIGGYFEIAGLDQLTDNFFSAGTKSTLPSVADLVLPE